MYWFIRTCAFLLLLVSSVSSSEKDEQEPEQPKHIKVTNDDELLKCFQNKNFLQPAPKIKQLHIAYEISPILLNGLLPESECFVQPQIKELESLSLNIKGKGYKPSRLPFIGRFIQVPLQHIGNNFRHIPSLDLSYTQLTVGSYDPFVFVDIKPLATIPRLQTLILRDTGLKRFLDFKKFRALTELDVSHNDFLDNTTFPCTDLSNLSTLVMLNISYSNIENFFGGYAYLSNLEELDVEGNYHLQLPNLAPLIKLRELNIADSRNFNSDDLASLSALHNLEVINLSGNGVFARNFVQLLETANLRTVRMSRDKYNRLMQDDRYFNLSELLRQTKKEIIICDETEHEREYEERCSSYDVEGLITSDDFIEYDRRWNYRGY